MGIYLKNNNSKVLKQSSVIKCPRAVDYGKSNILKRKEQWT